MNAAQVLNQRIAKSFCFRPLTDVLTRKSNAPPGGPHFGSNSRGGWAVLELTGTSCRRKYLIPILGQFYLNSNHSSFNLPPVQTCTVVSYLSVALSQFSKLFSYASFPYFNKLFSHFRASRQENIQLFDYDIYYDFLKPRIHNLLGMRRSLADFFVHKHIMFEKKNLKFF